MKCPSAADLIKNLKIDAAVAKLIRQIAKAAEDPDKLRRIIDARCPKTAAYVRGMYNDPYDSDMWCVTVALHAINDLAGGYGVEGLGRIRGPDYAPPYEYINMGDTYATTLIYRRRTDSLSIGTWGDIVDRRRSRKAKTARPRRTRRVAPAVASDPHARCAYYGTCVAKLIDPLIQPCS